MLGKGRHDGSGEAIFGRLMHGTGGILVHAELWIQRQCDISSPEHEMAAPLGRALTRPKTVV